MGKKKLFNLLSGESIHVAPNTKVIPAKVFTKALSAADILSHAQEAIDKYRMEVANECERLKAQAQQEGFQEGFVRWAEHLAELEREIQNVNRATEKMIIPRAKAAKKILGREIELSDQAVVDIVASKLKAVKQANRSSSMFAPWTIPNLKGIASNWLNSLKNWNRYPSAPTRKSNKEDVSLKPKAALLTRSSTSNGKS